MEPVCKTDFAQRSTNLHFTYLLTYLLNIGVHYMQAHPVFHVHNTIQRQTQSNSRSIAVSIYNADDSENT